MLKFIHTADFHLGIKFSRLRGPNIQKIRQEDIRTNVERIADIAIQKGVHIVFVSGDVFNTSNPSPKDEVVFGRFVGKLAKNNIHVVVIPGNHDIPKHPESKNPLEALEESAHPYYHYIGSAKNPARIIHTEAGSVGVIGIPYIDPRILVENPQYDYSTLISTIIERKISDIASADYKVLMAHLLVKGVKITSTRFVYVDEPTIPLEALYPERFDYIALGHIHAGSRVSDNAYYSGSIERMAFDEEKDNKFIVYGEIYNNNKIKLEEIPLPTRNMTTLKFYWKNLKFLEIRNQLREALSKIPPKSIVRLRITADSTTLDMIMREQSHLENILLESGVIGYLIERLPIEVEGEIEKLVLENIDVLRLVEDYISSIAPAHIKNRALKFAREIIGKVSG